MPLPLVAEVLAGLSARPRRLPCKLFYDERGVELYGQIVELEEYYVSRTELGILRSHAREIAARLGERALIVELGSGSGEKTRLLLENLVDPVGYAPIDISPAFLDATVRDLRARMPELELLPRVADYMQDFEVPVPPSPAARTVFFFPGSTIGNLTHPESTELFTRLRRLGGEECAILLGADLEKDAATLVAAYDDASGVTARFNLNLLERLVRECDAVVDVSAFAHRAIYDPAARRIEMHLVSRVAQDLEVAGRRFHLAAGDSICTELSHKYTLERLAELAAPAGLGIRAIWQDARGWFVVALLEDSDAGVA